MKNDKKGTIDTGFEKSERQPQLRRQANKEQPLIMASPKALAADYFTAYSWQSRVVSVLMRRFVKASLAKVRLSPRVMKFSQLGFDAVTLALPVSGEVHISPARVGGVPGEWVSAGRNSVSGRVLLYFHGGGYFFGSPRSHRALTWRLSKECRAKVLALDYRQPPDWKYPAPLEDAVAAYKGLLERGYRPENILLGGDSAGGNLALVTLLRLRDKGIPLPAAAILISPWADLSCSGASIETNAATEQFIPVNALKFVARTYSRQSDSRDALISPIYADLSGLPPLFIQVSGTEVLYDDAARIASNAQAAGVPCQLQVWDKMMHVFQVLAGWMPEAHHAVGEIGCFARGVFGDKTPRRRRARLLSPIH